MSSLKQDDPYHERLQSRPILYAAIGVVHTLLTAGIVFGWASLLPLLRLELHHVSPTEFARIFTHGAIGNYLSTLPFGVILDRFGPKTCSIIASILFGCGCVLMAQTNQLCINLGFTLLGFSGPGIQLPTLHLARLFPGQAREGGTGGAALFMSCQAGAFDGGTMVFALFSVVSNLSNNQIGTSAFFYGYLVVPVFTLLTAILVWPNEILPDATAPPSSLRKRKSYVGMASPYLSPAATITMNSNNNKSILIDAPLSTILSKPPFYCLAVWVSVHILKLNFVVASINDQLDYNMDRDRADLLIQLFGAILPFGFVALPVVAYLLSQSTLLCFQVANVVGVLYGAVLTFCPDQAWYQVLVVFTSVATSRQLVYSTVFHQTGELFGFANYGVLLGLINVVVSFVSFLQGPLVDWAESVGDYFGANMVLLCLTVPLFGLVYSIVPKADDSSNRSNNKTGVVMTESTPLVLGQQGATTRPRSNSDAGIL